MLNTYYLKNKMRLVCEYMPFSKSVSVGIWVKAGSMYENSDENGISHFIEHMLFKGTKRRTAEELAEETDFIGGQINAYTARECTVYYTRTLSKSLTTALDILSDMYYNSIFSNEDIELERNVILEEISMYEDSPEDVALDSIGELVWKGSPLGSPVAGTSKSVKKITRDMMLDYMNRRYSPENTVISIAGQFDENEIVSLCEEYFDINAKGETDGDIPVVFNSGIWRRKKKIEQTHLSIAYPCFTLMDDRIYEVSLLNNIFGGSMSSRLFQSVREKNGLCYSVYSYSTSFPKAGMFGIYTALASQNIERVNSLINEEIERICSDLVSPRELEKARSQTLCSIIMGGESISTKMNDNGKSQLLLGLVRNEKEVTDKINAVSANSIREAAQSIFNKEKCGKFILER